MHPIPKTVLDYLDLNVDIHMYGSVIIFAIKKQAILQRSVFAHPERFLLLLYKQCIQDEFKF